MDFKEKIARIVVLVTYGVGAVALFTPWRQWVLPLTPVHLLVSFFFLLRFQRWSKPKGSVVWRLMAVVVLSFLVEVAGVHTGKIFGVYAYLPALGPQLWDVPLIIGVNWAFLTLMALNSVPEGIQKPVHRAAVAAIAITLLDALIERSAPFMNMWWFVDGKVPLDNAIGWVITGFAMALILQPTLAREGPPREKNPLNGLFWSVQIAFFGLALVAQMGVN